MDEQGKIRLLSEDLIGKIAAGEVIERPASVIKELVENSIDAGSTRIEVEIRDGGKELIRVTDDGIGMSAADAKMAFFRHATSKLSKEEDLFSIMTLGFRGEALPSIGAVSRVELVTRRWEDDAGVSVKFDAGNLVETSPVGTPPGTTVTVRHLFYNVPARLKFLKSTQTESRACVSIVSSLALAHPEIAFQMIRDDNKVFATAGSGRLIDAIMGVYGPSVSKDLVELHFGRDDIRIRGYVSKPEAARKSRNYQVFFVNGRYFQSNLIRAALEKGFEGFIPRGRFPAGIIDIRIDPSNVDVNVHPSKLEIKFKDEQAIFQAVMISCRRALSGLSPFRVQEEPSGYGGSLEEERIQASLDLFKVVPGDPQRMRKSSSLPRDTAIIEERLPDKEYTESGNSRDFEQMSFKTHDGRDVLDARSLLDVRYTTREVGHAPDVRGAREVGDVPGVTSPSEIERAPEFGSARDARGALDVREKRDARDSLDVRDTAGARGASDVKGIPDFRGIPDVRGTPDFRDVRNGREVPDSKGIASGPADYYSIVGQLHATYIIVQVHDGMLLIDQHAAHERIIYEELSNTESVVESQAMLVPETVDLDRDAFQLMEQNIDLFLRVGFEVEAFGGSTVIVRAVPVYLEGYNPAIVLRDILDELSEARGRIDDLRSKLNIVISCKSAVKAGDTLSMEEMKELVSRLFSLSDIYTCPHGRPAAIKITTSDLEKRFFRVL